MENETTDKVALPLIYNALDKIMEEIEPISKSDENTFHKFKYRSIDRLVNAIQPFFKKHHVIIIPTIHSHEITERSTNKEGKQYYSDMVINYKLLCTIDGSFIEVLVPAGAADNGDKHFSKALSMALKYMLNQVFLIPTGDPDPDSEVHDNTGSYKQSTAPKQVKSVHPTVEQAQQLYNRHKHQLSQANIDAAEEAIGNNDIERCERLIAFLKTYDTKQL